MLPTPTKIMVEREDRPRKSILKVTIGKGKNNENPDLFDNEDNGEVRLEVPIDEIEILKYHIESRDEELIRQRELIATMLKQNEELIKAVKSL
jgi:hypothetical protein